MSDRWNKNESKLKPKKMSIAMVMTREVTIPRQPLDLKLN
jgi:hypothetical protein